jgi:serine/threonine-protein kinase
VVASREGDRPHRRRERLTGSGIDSGRTMSAAEKQRTIGAYLVEARVASGGMAEIFRARPPLEFRDAIGREIVAIKTLLPSIADDPQFREMFEEEAEITTTLHHPNVVELVDFGRTETGALFLVMEWVDGIDLGQAMRSFRRRRLRLHPLAACTIVEAVLRGLHAAHTRLDRDGIVHPVVHRDVSPANVLLSRSGDVKLADFGLARPLDRVRRTLPGIVKGKFAYLAPEQAFDRAVDPRTDIFAAGIVLWEALSGRHLFRREDDAQTVLSVRRAQVPDLRRYAPGIDERIVAAIQRALQADPEARHATAKAFADELLAWLRDQPVWDPQAIVAAVVREVSEAEGRSSGTRPVVDPRRPSLITAPMPLTRRRRARLSAVP